MAKSNKMSKDESPKKTDELDSFKRFIEKRRIQNEALKKIIDKMDDARGHKQ